MSDDSIAVVDLDQCQPDRCNYECINYCPPNRTGKECITRRGDDTDEGDPGQVKISEEICLGESCGICVEKCPFDAIRIVNLPSELEDDPAHQYGRNAFRLYGLPIPTDGQVTGILGPNGIGKTTAVQILADEIVPNLGEWTQAPDWDSAIDAYSGTELQDYFTDLVDASITVARKPQYVDRIPEQVSGTTRELLAGTNERDALDDLIEQLSLAPILDQPIEDLSGGELQRVTIAATLARDADFYFLDEITPYLDISQRIAAARAIRTLAEEHDRSILVVEHDLAVLDLLADTLHVAYGEPNAFGVITDPKSVRNGINEYLAGYLENENVRIRPEAIEFEEHAPQRVVTGSPLIEYPSLEKQYGDDGFSLTVDGGTIYQNEVLGVVGPNGIGKSTFANLLAGDLAPDTGTFDADLDISYKPQYIEADRDLRVDTFLSGITDDFGSSYWSTEIASPLQLDPIMEQRLTDLSGGERQRVAIAACLSQDADLYLFDEPSAHLDVEQRVQATDAIRRYAESRDATVLVIDHDIYLIDLLADRLLVFDGKPAVAGHAGAPQDMRSGMNDFLSNLGITFRRDERAGRPRINKPGSQLDREQKRVGEYYYAPTDDA